MESKREMEREQEEEEEEEEEANLKRFLSWAAQLGISDSPSSSTQSEDATCHVTCLGRTLVVSHFPEAGGRGLAAARDLRKGELILKVPKEALMTSQSLMMKDETLSFAINKHLPSLSSTQILAVVLLNEMSKGKTSWWYPYLKQMPRCYDTLSSFSQLEIQSLQMEDAIWAAEKAVEKAELEWKGASPILGELKLKPQLCTLKAWLWASATVLLSYGTYTNLELLEHYGFLLNENPNEKVFIPLEPEMYSLCSWPRESIHIHQDGKPSFVLLSTLRLWAIPGNLRRSTRHLAYSGHLLSAENEVAVMKWLAKTCHCMLEALPTSIEQDELLLRIIEKTRDTCQLIKLDEKQSWFSPEHLAFLKTSGTTDREICLQSLVSSKRRKSVCRLQLAVQWRLNYKKSLADCFKHCTELINNCLRGGEYPRP